MAHLSTLNLWLKINPSMDFPAPRTPRLGRVTFPGHAQLNWMGMWSRKSPTGGTSPKWCITLWLFNIAMENGPFIDGLPIKNGDFAWLC